MTAEIRVLDSNQHRYAARAREHRHMRIRASVRERHAAAVPCDLQESRGRQIGCHDDRPGSDWCCSGAAELAQHTIAHVAQVRSTRTEVQVVGFVIMAYLQAHRRVPCGLSTVTSVNSGECRLGD